MVLALDNQLAKSASTSVQANVRKCRKILQNVLQNLKKACKINTRQNYFKF